MQGMSYTESGLIGVSPQVSLFSWGVASIIHLCRKGNMDKIGTGLLVHVKSMSHPHSSSSEGFWRTKLAFFSKSTEKLSYMDNCVGHLLKNWMALFAHMHV